MKLNEIDVRKPEQISGRSHYKSQNNDREVTWAELQKQAIADKEFAGLDDDMTWGGNDQMIAVTSTPHYKQGMQIPKE